jgi:hypothetical protein
MTKLRVPIDREAVGKKKGGKDGRGENDDG